MGVIAEYWQNNSNGLENRITALKPILKCPDF